MPSVQSQIDSDILEIDLKTIFDKIFKHRHTIISTVILCVSLALLYSFSVKPVYKATSRIMVDAAPPKIVKVEGTVLPDYTDRTNLFSSQIEILKSRTVAELVMQDIGGYEPWYRRDKAKSELKVISHDELINDLLSHVKIVPVRMTLVIEISVEDYSPELAARIANSWTRAYILFSSIDQFVQRRSELESDLAQQSKYLKEKHPVIIALRSELELIDSKMRNERERVMKDRDGVQSSSGNINNVKVLDRAQVPLKPVKPRKALNVLFAVFFGLFISTVLSFIFESLDQTIKSTDNIPRILGLAGLVPIPFFKKSREHSDIGPEFISARLRHSIIAESFRGLRTSIIFSDPDLPKKTFMITSIAPSEGKTTVAINLATVFAQADERVLLVDADLRNPRVHTVFNIARGSGVSDILAYGKEDIKADIYKTDIPNLDVLTCGAIPPNPSELLGSMKMTDFITRLAGMYDRVIFDAPPILAATDAVILATKVDASLLVVKAGDTRQQAAVRAVGILKSVPAHILGVVLNMVDITEPGSYYYYHYSSVEDKDKNVSGGKGKKTISPGHTSTKKT